MENNENRETKFVTANQQMLIQKILQSKKILDSEYRELRAVIDEKVVSSYDASVVIAYVLAKLNYRRTFFNGKHKAYKKCCFCSSRDNLKRYDDLDKKNMKVWSCETCALNLKDRLVPVKMAEENEIQKR